MRKSHHSPPPESSRIAVSTEPPGSGTLWPPTSALRYRRCLLVQRIEPLVGIPNEGQVHLGDVLFTQLLDLHAMQVRIVVLIDLVRGEVRAVDVGTEARLERRADLSEVFEDDTFEEGMGADIHGSELPGRGSETVGSVAKKARSC